ncbi:cysteine hydrolase [Pusillimonas sp. CC-YST705]|uniref:Cysteine hydrolase n=1 Tax=Mesopusillimonas faecipullorum TaxID=2755040 RepID=A0ABS8C8Q1_9BURK|nr:isochorismatase family cysteine hydrolase [Mesopusillimonas faecipullorum]MCB5362399.1 cysteine hydrolase [Mesopusillimonas faecipullorum]
MNLGVDVVRPAVIAIDLHRGHLDPEVATMPLSAERSKAVIETNRVFFEKCRAAGIPVIHLLTLYRSVEEIRTNPFWRTRAEDPTATRKNVLKHNLWGSPGTEVITELLDERDWVVNTKRRYDCFIGSDLEFTLKNNGINTLLLTGVNTNSCVLATTVAACVRDFAAILIEECVDTIDGPKAHEAALTCVRAAFGWVMSGDEALAAVRS